MKQGLSVVVCCYNSVSRLPETLAHLLRQQITGFDWEIIVVDNASTDDTFSVAEKLLAQHSPPVKYKVVNEPEPGLSNARKKGHTTAQYEFVLFCDDDNWLAPNYLQLGYDIMHTQPEIGI